MSVSNLKTKAQLAMSELLDRMLVGRSPIYPVAPSRSLDLSELEERILLSASPVMVVAPEMADGAFVDSVPAETALLDTQDGTTGVSSTQTTDQPSSQTGSNETTAPTQTVRHEIVFLDTSVDDYQQLLDGLWSNADPSREFEVVLLQNSRDGIEQITEALTDRTNLDAVHIVSHGTDAAVKLGSTWLTQDNLAGYVGEIARWGSSFTADADILFYGCDLAASPDGELLVDSIRMLTGADVAASNDDTGHAILGGNWELEYAAGQIETSVAISAAGQISWNHVLAVNHLTGMWSGSGPVTASTSDTTPIGVTATFSTPAGSDIAVDTASAFTINNFFSSSYVQGATSLGLTVHWDTTPEAGETPASDDAVTTTVTFIFDTAVVNPILHVDRIGGAGNSLSNSSEWTVVTPGATLTKLAGVDHFNVTSSTFYRTPNDSTNANLEASSSSSLGTASGSIQVNGTFTTLTFTVDAVGVEGAGGDSLELIWELDADVNQAPAITLPGGAVNYVENDPATIIDATATVSDSDSADFDTGTLTIDFSSNGTANDRLAIRNQGTGSGQIGVSGSTVTYEGTTIGTFSGGTDGTTPLVVTFNTSSTPVAAQALLRNVTFANISESPSELARIVRFVLTDGDGGTSNAAIQTINVASVNDVPVITSNGGGATSAVDSAENSTAITTVTSSDVDGGTASYSISGGADAAKFAIDAASGVLTFVTAPDFENPTDTGGDNVYDVTVEVSDDTLTDTQDIAVTVIAVNDNTPTITSDGGGATAAIDVSENSSLATVVTATDADLPAESRSYSITGGVDAAGFLIDGSSGVLQFVAPPDYETPTDAGHDNVYDVIVQVTDGTFSDSQAIAVTILNASEVATSFADTAIWRSSGTTAPIAATWNGSSFGTAEKTVTAGQWRLIDGAESPSRDEKIVVGVSAAGVISGEMYAGGNWSTLPFSMASGASSGEHGFDVVYESVSGNALLVWNNGSTGTNSVSYRTWDGSIWSAEQTATAPLSGRATQIKLVSDPNSDSIIMLVTTSSSDDYAIVWDGNSWGTGNTLGTTSGQTRDSAVGIESLSGQGLAIYDDVAGGTELDYRVWNGSTWSAASMLNPPAGITGDPRFVITASDPLSDRIALAALTSANEIWFSIWDGSTWTSSITASTNASTSSSISMAISFESESGQLLATYAESENTTVSYLTWTSAGGWSNASSTPSIGGVPNSMTLSSDADTDRIMLAVQDSNSDLHYVQWDGSSWSAVNTLDLDTGETSAQPFLFLYDASVNVNPVITSNGASASASINVAENSTAVTTVTATDTDLPAQTLNFSITGGADAAKFSINSATGTLRFISAPNRETPTDAGSNNVYDVIVQVSDRDGGTDSQSIAVSVTDLDEFDITAISDIGATLDNVDENAAIGSTVGITAFASDADATASGILYTLDNDAAGQFAIDGATGQVTVAAAIDREAGATRTITVRATSDDGSTSTQNYTIAINDLNDNAPIVDADQASSVSEFAANGDSVGTATATDQDVVGTISNWMIVSGNDDGVFELDPSSGKLRVADNARLNFEIKATYVLGLSVDDGANTSSTETVTIHVIDENDNPVLLANAGISVVEGDDVVIRSVELSVTDEDDFSDEIRYGILESPVAGRLELTDNPGVSIDVFTQADINNNRVQFVHDGSEADDSFTFVVSDGSGGTIGPTLFSITNLRVNDVPINLVPGSPLTSEDSPLTFSFAMGNEITVTDVDLNGAMIGVRLVATHGTVTLGSTAGLVFASGTGIADSDVVFAGLIADVNAALDGLRFDPTPDYNGPASIRIISRDMGNSGSGGEQMDDDTIDIFVKAVNDNSVATDDEFSTSEDNILTVTAASGLLSNDADVDGDTLSVIAVTGTANGSLSLNADGSFVYTPNLNFNGTDSFTYRATDGSLQSETRTVTLNVAAVNDTPVSFDDSYTMDQLTVLKVEASDGVLINDLDIEADKLQAVLVNGPQNGRLILNADGSLTYTPDASFAGEVTFTYRAFDGTAAGSIATVRIIVRQTVTSGMPGSNGDGVTVEADTFDGEGMTDGKDKTRIVAASAVNPVGNTSSNLSANMPTNMSMTDSDSTTTTADDGATDSDAGLNGNLHNELHTFATTFRIDERGALRDRMTDRSFEDAGVVFSSTDVGSMVYVLEQTGFWTELDTFQQDVKDSVLQEGEWEELVVETTTVAGTTLTVGYIVWLLRSGSFVFGLISSLPAWTMMDPLLVLQSGLESSGDGDNSDDDSLLGILQSHQDGMESSAESFEI